LQIENEKMMGSNQVTQLQNTVSQFLPFGEVRRDSSFNAYNSMKAYSYNGERYGYYGYDASGERTYKYDMYSAGSWTNETGGMNVSLQIDKMMLYPNGYLNMNQNGEYTKHYYADALRIASKIGNGFSQDLCTEANQIGNKLDSTYLDERGDRQYVEMKEELSELIHGNQVIDVLPIPYPDTNLCNLSGSGIETALFFYHPDHLGSTGMVTDNSSNITQGFLHAPFGEIITEFNPSWESGRIPKYSFNAKELDEENGMYYYSARYYAPPTFISRDPMFEKYPSISPYTYCANNPMKYVDPTGMEAGSPSTHTDENGNVIAVYNDGDLGVYAHSKSEIDAYKKDNSKKLENNSDQYKGATLDENSFKKGDKIDFGSYNAKKWIDRFEKYNKNVVIGGFAAKLAYALNAKNGGIYDPKSYMKNGSQISEGVYVSPRDLGNFAAGAFGRLSGMNKHRMLAGFGAFNLSGNSIITFMTYFNKACELGALLLCHHNYLTCFNQK
jgi:RHS repeat-associated protein